ncbi:MAG: GLUG motif-containing protein, partial [Sedimentisphaerales bacterium]
LVSVLTLSVLQNAYGFSGQGSGTEQDPYIITDVYQLQEMNNDVDAWYELGNDIDASDTINWNGGEGFVPIGNYSTDNFTGNFDGKNLIITNLFINRIESQSQYQGLFAFVNGGNIQNVGLTNVYVSGGRFVGGLVAYQIAGTISNSYSTGEILGNSHYVGGLIGFSVSGTIVSNSHSISNVSGVEYIGGLVGMGYGLTISNSYSISTVSGAWDIGGLVGQIGGPISNSYSISTVSGEDFVGGLVGDAPGWAQTISNSYSISTVSGNDFVGGLVGNNCNYGTCLDSYWNIDLFPTSACGEGKTTVEMKQIGTFTNWDFTQTWGIEDNQTYPFLKLTYPIGDLNHNKVVNFLDFAILASHWLEGT